MFEIRISPKHQITIPQAIFDESQLEVGDVLHAAVDNGKIILTPKRLADNSSDIKLTPSEQKILLRAKAKIKRIQYDLLNSKGLSVKETEIAAKAGLIAEDQRYFWTEKWQKSERAEEIAVRNRDVSPSFDNAGDAIAYLHTKAAKK